MRYCTVDPTFFFLNVIVRTICIELGISFCAWEAGSLTKIGYWILETGVWSWDLGERKIERS